MADILDKVYEQIFCIVMAIAIIAVIVTATYLVVAVVIKVQEEKYEREHGVVYPVRQPISHNH